MEGDNAARTHMHRHATKHLMRLRLEHQNESADCGIKWLIEVHVRWVSLEKPHVAVAAATSPGRIDGARCTIDTDHRAGRAHHVGKQKTRVA